MKNNPQPNQNQPQALQKRITALEQQLAQAQAAVQALTSAAQAVPDDALAGSAGAPAGSAGAPNPALRRFELLFAQSRDSILFVHPEDGRILDANAAALDAYGYSREELLGLTIHDLRAPATQAHIFAQMQAANAGDVLFETVHQRKDGSLFPVEVSSSGADDGPDRTLISIIRDITARKQLEEERRRLLGEFQQQHAAAQKLAEELKAVIDAMHDPVLVYNREGVIVRVNPSAVRAHGFDPTSQHRQATNMNLAIRYPDGRTAPADALPSERALNGESVIGERLELTNPLGQQLVLEVTATPLVVAGVQAGAVSVWHDITRQQQAEQALRESEERYRVAVMNFPAVYAQTDRELRYTWIHNPHPDFRPGDVIGRRDDELDDGEDTRRLVALKRQVLESGVGMREEISFQRSDGVYTYDLTIEPRRTPDGRIVGVTTAALDITRRKRAENAIRESEARFRQLADSMPQLVWTARPDGRVDYYNRRHLEYYGISPEAGESWEWAPVLHPDDLPATQAAWQTAVETGETYQIEHRVRLAGGAYRWHLSRGVPARDEAGRILRWYGTATNIHELKLAEEKLALYAQKLEDSNRALQEFAYAASHDLQEPLRKIEAFGDLLLESTTVLDDRQRDYLERMRRAAGRLRDMVDGLLQLSRIETQGGPFAQVDLAAVAGEVLSDLEDQIRRTGGRVEIGALPVVNADPVQMQQLLQNLIGNALKYHRPGVPPLVRVDGARLAQAVQLRVVDNGIGFHPGQAERMFLPFTRLVGRSEYEGSGMGLAICRRIVERHAGEITASGAPGEGAVFVVTLPAGRERSQG